MAVLLSLGFAILLAGFTAIDYYESTSSHQQMISMLKELRERYHNSSESLLPGGKTGA